MIWRDHEEVIEDNANDPSTHRDGDTVDIACNPTIVYPNTCSSLVKFTGYLCGGKLV